MVNLYDTIDATWAPKKITKVGPWKIREGAGGGSRVSSASLVSESFNYDDVLMAETAMQALGLSNKFIIRENDQALDHMLETRGYNIFDPVYIFEAAIQQFSQFEQDSYEVFMSEMLLGIQAEIWKVAGVDNARLAVMERVKKPKTYILGRCDDEAAGVAFTAIYKNMAMLNAFEIVEKFRGKGLGKTIMVATANWASSFGATSLSAVVRTENNNAVKFYEALGMRKISKYHYRVLNENYDG